jgi:propionyl-CoA carboxylase alpha chain/3-methylcrotonyl-CoA carboxylase alpha subunit
VRAIAVYSVADADAPHVAEADGSVLIGPPPARDSYLKGDAILAAARQAGAEAIHPGYGFLSEHADFAEAVIAAGIVWVGPPPAAIRAMGLKDAAKRLMAPACPPRRLSRRRPVARVLQAAAIGWPVLIGRAGGGGAHAPVD